MKKKLIFLLTLISVFIIPLNLEAAPRVSAHAAILMDSKTGEIIFSKNAEELRQPASTTKILTALLTIERCNDFERVVTISNNCAATGEASINLRTGEHITIGELLHGALLKSGNDACVALAEAIAPSEEEFVGLMNMKAKSLGALNSNFCNTNGLPCKNHLTTAYDLAVIARYAMKNQVFSEIVKKKNYTLHWSDSPRVKSLKNTNKLLWLYPYTTGVKTGTTDKAGKCLVASGKNEEREMIVVVLNSPDRYGDAQRMLEYGLKGEYLCKETMLLNSN